MFRKQMTFVVSLIALIMLLAIYGIAAAGKMEDAFQLLKSMDKPIQFYGKVIDQNNEPVGQAQVVVQISNSFGVRELSFGTDVSGQFRITNESGNGFSIIKIVMTGYEFNIKTNLANRSFEVDDNYRADPANPVIYKVRKKEPPATVVPGSLSLKLNQQRSEYEVDLVEGSRGTPGKFGKAPFQREKHADIFIKGMLSDDQKTLVIVFSAPDQSSGVQLSDQLLYVTPEMGYLDKDGITISLPGEIVKYLYVKGRNGKLYSRIDLKIRVASNMTADIAMDSWTNPTGSRNVDYDSELFRAWLRNR